MKQNKINIIHNHKLHCLNAFNNKPRSDINKGRSPHRNSDLVDINVKYIFVASPAAGSCTYFPFFTFSLLFI